MKIFYSFLIVSVFGYGSNGGSSGYGDPHFHILGISDSQPDICFDYNGTPGTNITLIKDNNTGFKAQFVVIYAYGLMRV